VGIFNKGELLNKGVNEAMDEWRVSGGRSGSAEMVFVKVNGSGKRKKNLCTKNYDEITQNILQVLKNQNGQEGGRRSVRFWSNQPSLPGPNVIKLFSSEIHECS
jgi:hypothetical protein